MTRDHASHKQLDTAGLVRVEVAFGMDKLTSLLSVGATAKLVEDVEVTLALRLIDDSRLFEQDCVQVSMSFEAK